MVLTISLSDIPAPVPVVLTISLRHKYSSRNYETPIRVVPWRLSEHRVEEIIIERRSSRRCVKTEIQGQVNLEDFQTCESESSRGSRRPSTDEFWEQNL